MDENRQPLLDSRDEARPELKAKVLEEVSLMGRIIGPIMLAQMVQYGVLMISVSFVGQLG